MPFGGGDDTRSSAVTPAPAAPRAARVAGRKKLAPALGSPAAPAPGAPPRRAAAGHSWLRLPRRSARSEPPGRKTWRASLLRARALRSAVCVRQGGARGAACAVPRPSAEV